MPVAVQLAFPHCTLSLILEIHTTLLDEIVTGSITLCSYYGKPEILLDEIRSQEVPHCVPTVGNLRYITLYWMSSSQEVPLCVLDVENLSRKSKMSSNSRSVNYCGMNIFK